MKKPKVGQSVDVWWDDPAMAGGWWDQPERMEPAHCRTRAFVAAITKEHLVVSHTQAHDGSWMGVAAIPWGVVRKIVVRKR